MNTPLILHLETSTDICSVALSEGNRILSLAESGPERSHATLLNQYIRKVMEESQKEFIDLDAVSVSRGPGSYTGLRIGVSTAKGLAYALEKPLLSCGTLECLTRAAINSEAFISLPPERKSDFLFCPMLDARRMEVYTALYSPELELIREVSAEIINEQSFRKELDGRTVIFFGNGSDKCREIILHPNAVFLDSINPGAAAMVPRVLSEFRQEHFEDVAYFEPFYLKDFIVTIPRKKVL